jgi:hypothetical protein
MLVFSATPENQGITINELCIEGVRTLLFRVRLHEHLPLAFCTSAVFVHMTNEYLHRFRNVPAPCYIYAACICPACACIKEPHRENGKNRRPDEFKALVNDNGVQYEKKILIKLPLVDHRSFATNGCICGYLARRSRPRRCQPVGAPMIFWHGDISFCLLDNQVSPYFD